MMIVNKPKALICVPILLQGAAFPLSKIVWNIGFVEQTFYEDQRGVKTWFSRNKGQRSFDFQSNILPLPFISLALINFNQSQQL